MRLGVLDQSIAAEGRPQAEAIRNTVALAEHCERLGYDRFWVSEHHNHPTIVGTAPEILVAGMAARTSRIRIGSAGVMLPHYAPFKVAEQFRVLDALAPGRVDLGLGRAPGSDGLTAFALNPRANERPAEFPADIRDLQAWLKAEPLPEGHPFVRLGAFPQGDTAPQIWLLGSSNYGAQVAAWFGLPYAFAWFFTDGRGAREALDLYREHYRPSADWPAPHSAICVWALAADSEEEAAFHFGPRLRWRLGRDRGMFLPLESAEKAAAYDYSDSEAARLARFREQAIVGRPEPVAARIRAIGAELGVDEIAIVTWTHDETVRRRSYELMARTWGLAPC